MFGTIRQLFLLATRSNKLWIVPVALSLVIAAVLVYGASVSPVPLFLYPLI